MTDIEKPITEVASEAVTGGEPVAAEEPEQTLGQLTSELRFFTTALIVTHGGFDRDVLYEFNSRHPNPDPNLQPIAFDLDRPLFQGLGVTPWLAPSPAPINWDHRIYGIHESRFEELSRFVCSVAFSNPRTQLFVTIGAHMLQIVDVTALGQVMAANDLPTLPITVFCISTNKEFVYMKPAKDPPRTRAYPHSDPPTNDAIIAADAVFGPPPDPHAALRLR